MSLCNSQSHTRIVSSLSAVQPTYTFLQYEVEFGFAQEAVQGHHYRHGRRIVVSMRAVLMATVVARGCCSGHRLCVTFLFLCGRDG
ncbi:hypothetical protein Tsubulata_010000 [Turnera subulata]|uniref:Uncharacterized protein n=1 Tax=Turnera subulata TaxID=218843 RepID=A0A9Q0FV62_9ROSI|nr:hypothetical protein Tsubulata_010000 [Turnera subulata]